MDIKICKLRDNAKIPYKKHINDAGFDLTWAPSSKEIINDILSINGQKYKNAIILPPNTSKIFETGLKVNFPHGNVLEIKNRSGVAANKGLLVGACLVDSTYTGEIFVNLHNVSTLYQVIESGDRIAQFVVYKIENCLFSEISNEEYVMLETSERGEGAFGSTGNN